MPSLAFNKTATADYHILEKLEAGIALTGPEVKSVKAGRINLKGSYVTVNADRTAWLLGAHVSPYAPAKTAQTNYDPTRSRQLLLRRKEIDYLAGKRQEAGLTILPLSVYTKGGLIKVELAIGRGKKQFDKRASIKKRESDREIRRLIRGKS